MNKRFGTIIFCTLLIGGVLGLLLGVSNSNLMLAWAGVLVGTFIGWFIAAIDLNKEKTKQSNRKQLHEILG